MAEADVLVSDSELEDDYNSPDDYNSLQSLSSPVTEKVNLLLMINLSFLTI